MKRLALLFLLVPAFVAACGGSSGDDGLASAPTAPPSEAPSEAAAAPTAPAEEPAAAPQGEEIGEQRGIGGVADEEMSADDPAETLMGEESSETAVREEDTSRPEAPVINGSDLDGNPISLEDFKGTAVIVKVFAEH